MLAIDRPIFCFGGGADPHASKSPVVRLVRRTLRALDFTDLPCPSGRGVELQIFCFCAVLFKSDAKSDAPFSLHRNRALVAPRFTSAGFFHFAALTVRGELETVAGGVSP